MKQTLDFYYKEFLKNREKIVLMLINEIIFLNHCLKKSNNQNVTKAIIDAIAQLEALLEEIYENVNELLSKEIFKSFILKSYEIFKGIVQAITESIGLDTL